MPREGFIKLTRGVMPDLAGPQRIALIRKGNELFNAGKIEAAKRVFLTAKYGDGLGRVGDYCLEHGDPLEALRMYWLAPAPDKVAKLIERISSVVQSWMNEGEGVDEKRGSV
jgi:hypothetical protein